MQDGQVKIGCLTRSSVESSKEDLANALQSSFELAGCEVEVSGDYAGWTTNIDSSMLKGLKAKYL